MALVTELPFRIGWVALNIGRPHAKTIKESAYVSIRSQAPKGSSSHPCPSRRIGPRGFGIPDLMRVNPAHNGIAMAKVAGTAFPQVLAGCRTGVGLSQASLPTQPGIPVPSVVAQYRSEEHTSELQS